MKKKMNKMIIMKMKKMINNINDNDENKWRNNEENE